MSITNDDFDLPSAPEFDSVSQKFGNDRNYDQKTK